MKWPIIALLLVAPWPALAAPCAPGGSGTPMTSSGDDRFRATLSTEPAAIKAGLPFKVMLSVCSDTGATIEQLGIDATMPAHRHGMNYRPEVTSLGDGRYEARGFLFHMPGAWEFAVTIHSSGRPTRLRLDVDVR